MKSRNALGDQAQAEEWREVEVFNVIDWLNTNAGAVQGIAVAILALITAFYAWQTTRPAQETKRMAKTTERVANESHMPFVVFERTIGPIIPDDHYVFTCMVRNVGVGPAFNVTGQIESPNIEFNIENAPVLPVARFLEIHGKATNLESTTLGSQEWKFESNPPLRLPSSRADFHVIAEYGDLLGNKFQSALKLSGDGGLIPDEFTFHRL